MERFWVVLISSIILLVIGLIIFFSCLTHIENYELGYTFDSRTGEFTVLDHGGYILTPPFVVSVHKIDTRPLQVCINANARVLNCKLVQFNPSGLDTFLAWHGRDNYDLQDLNPLLMSYAYDGSGKTYPFLKVLRELKPEEAQENLNTQGAE